MARTRGASLGIQRADGELIDKEGKPVHVAGGTAVMEEERPQPSPGPTRYICNGATLRRDMDAWTLAKLLELAMGGAALEISITPEECNRLHPDVRQHFRPVV